ncbi:MAG TPA: type II secretion system protein [Gemmatimonadaceae bacterium]
MFFRSPERRQRHGFTLIELLVVVVIIGILAAIAIPKFSNTKGKSYVAAMKSDLRNLATAQEAYSYEHSVYTDNLDNLSFKGSPAVTLTVTVDAGGWAGEATHALANPLVCQLWFGSGGPMSIATEEGKVACSN